VTVREPVGGGNGWNDIIPLDTGHYACRWHHNGAVSLVGCDHLTEVEAHTHCYDAAKAREAIHPPATVPEYPTDLTERILDAP
jgi:hypothetical protein